MQSSRLALLFLTPVYIIGLSFGLSWMDCGQVLDKAEIRFDGFSAYPSPVEAGSYVHVSAMVTLGESLSAASVRITMYFGNTSTGDSVLDVSGVDLCNWTNSIQCPFSTGTQNIIFDWQVPHVAPGPYTVHLSIITPGNLIDTGCVQFTVYVSDPSISSAKWVSSFSAFLIGTAAYEVKEPSARVLGGLIQLGPIGELLPVVASDDSPDPFSWGTMYRLTGTEDIVHPYFDPSGYIWAFNGSMINSTKTATNDLVHRYKGDFYFGYEGIFGSYNTLGNFLLTGTFDFFWIQNIDPQSGDTIPSLNGEIYFNPEKGVFPAGWFNPISVGRLNPSVVSTTNTQGQFVVSGSKEYCITTGCTLGAIVPPPATIVSPNRGLTKEHQGLIIGLVLGFFLLLAVAIFLFFFIRRKRSHSLEDGVYVAPKKPEYGTALVADDIVQHAKGHSGAALPQLDHTEKFFPPAYLKDYSIPKRDSRRGRDYNRRSHRRSRRPASYYDDASPIRHSGSEYSGSESPGGHSRRSSSVSRSRSRSPRSTSPVSRSRTPDRTSTPSPTHSYSRESRASGSSRSRSSSFDTDSGSESDRPRRN